MGDEILNEKLADGRTAEEYILGHPIAHHPLVKVAEALGIGHEGITAGIQGKSGYGKVNESLLQFLHPLSLLFNGVKEFIHLGLYKRYATNKNLDGSVTHGVNLLNLLFEAVGVIFATATSLSVAPFLFLSIGVVSFLNSFPRMLYYGLNTLEYFVGDKRHNRFTEEYTDVKNKFVAHAKSSLISSIIGFGTGVLFVAPVVGVIAVSAVLTKVVSALVATTLGVTILTGIAKLSGIGHWLKNKLMHSTADEYKAIETVKSDPVYEQQAMYRHAANKYVTTQQKYYNNTVTEVTKKIRYI